MSDAARPPVTPMLPVAEARARILAAAGQHPRRIEHVRVEEADGRVLAADLCAKRTQPPFDVSAMDGFAIRAVDSDPPGQPLMIIGESAAGHPFPGRIEAGEATRIFTGAVVPEGADSVLIQERARVTGSMLFPEASVSTGLHIRRAGRDFTAGVTGLRAGTRLDPGTIALAGAMDHATLAVFARPRIGVLATGDELVPPGTEGAPADSIVATNSFAIAAILRRHGAEIRDFGIARDTEESLDAALDSALGWGADCLITIGGASVGKHDLVRPVLTRRGARQDFYKIAMRPGKPLNFGQLGTMLVAGLPGNPVSSFVCAHLFLAPLVAALQGESAPIPMRESALLGRDLPANDEREDYLRARLHTDENGMLVATPFGDQDSSLISVYAEARALVIRPAHAGAARAGEKVDILRI
ncbi:MAG: molybdopterin molybdotransferase MoeA [Proteobacteria bacterium]|nr:molybdopterin molybdotransferase MoeA [Pseudomonadota bacterium]